MMNPNYKSLLNCSNLSLNQTRKQKTGLTRPCTSSSAILAATGYRAASLLAWNTEKEGYSVNKIMLQIWLGAKIRRQWIKSLFLRNLLSISLSSLTKWRVRTECEVRDPTRKKPIIFIFVQLWFPLLLFSHQVNCGQNNGSDG